MSIKSAMSFLDLMSILTHLQLGTFGRAKAKVDELQTVIAESRRTGH